MILFTKTIKTLSHLISKSTVVLFAVIALVLIFAPVDNAINSQASDISQANTSMNEPEAKRREKKTLIVAGGCFWCVESDFEVIPGVSEATSGYINGSTDNPTYREVASKKTGHYEAVKIEYDPSIVKLETLVDYFWKTIDPTDDGGQFCDRGSPYKTGLFYQNEEQKHIFNTSLEKIKRTKPFKDDIVTPIEAANTFYPAEAYHQNYYVENVFRYILYRQSCGRDKRIKDLWGEVESKKYH